MATLVLALHAAPAADAPAHYRSLLAYHYAQAALVSGHRIEMIFFYGEAVLHAAAPESPEAATLIEQWQHLAQQHQIPLVVCPTYAETHYQLDTEQLPPPFTAGGLTEFSQAVARVDRVIQF